MENIAALKEAQKWLLIKQIESHLLELQKLDHLTAHELAVIDYALHKGKHVLGKEPRVQVNLIDDSPLIEVDSDVDAEDAGTGHVGGLAECVENGLPTDEAETELVGSHAEAFEQGLPTDEAEMNLVGGHSKCLVHDALPNTWTAHLDDQWDEKDPKSWERPAVQVVQTKTEQGKRRGVDNKPEVDVPKPSTKGRSRARESVNDERMDVASKRSRDRPIPVPAVPVEKTPAKSGSGSLHADPHDPFVGTTQTAKLAVSNGKHLQIRLRDRIEIVKPINIGWYQGRNERTGESGQLRREVIDRQWLTGQSPAVQDPSANSARSSRRSRPAALIVGNAYRAHLDHDIGKEHHLMIRTHDPIKILKPINPGWYLGLNMRSGLTGQFQQGLVDRDWQTWMEQKYGKHLLSTVLPVLRPGRSSLSSSTSPPQKPTRDHETSGAADWNDSSSAGSNW